MAVTFDGVNKHIIIDTDTTIDLYQLYSDSKEWDDNLDNMGYHYPFDASAEMLFTLRYGWKFKPSGYPEGSMVRIIGKITTTEGDSAIKTVSPTVGYPVTWQFDVPATAIVIETGGSALTEEEHDKLMKTLSTNTFVALSD